MYKDLEMSYNKQQSFLYLLNSKVYTLGSESYMNESAK